MTKDDLYRQLEYIRTLKVGWVSGALPIHDDIVDHVRYIVDNSSDGELSNWDVAPFINGSIIMSYRDGCVHSCINVAQAGMSAYVENGDDYKTWNVKIKTSDDVLRIFREVSNELK